VRWGRYNIIDKPELIGEVDKFLMNEDGTPKYNLLAFDLETNGTQLYKSAVVGFSFSPNSKMGFYVPILVWVPNTSSVKMLTRDKVKQEIFTDGHLLDIWTGKTYPEFVNPKDVEYADYFPALIERWFSKTQLFMWNAPFDVNHTFINFGIDLKNNLAADGGLLVHIRNENESVGLKESAVLYSEQLGINPFVSADQEKRELRGSIIRNGGTGYQVWRADLEPQGKYACADTFLTFGLVEVALNEIQKEHGENYPTIEKWIFDDEVMPLCKEVIIDIKRNGVYIDVPHFEKLKTQNAKKLLEIEDQFYDVIKTHMPSMTLGKSLDEAVSHQRLIKHIIHLEGLSQPQVMDKKTGEQKNSIAKAAVKAEYEKNPHWIWAYLLGEEELKYSESRLKELKEQLYYESEGRRYRFNINSNAHLIWLFFDCLGEDRKKYPKTEHSDEADPTPSLDADTIKEFLLPKFPWVSILLKYKKLAKIQSTYVEPALDYQIENYLYMDLKQNGTTSGRFSCSGGYNLQTLPKADVEIEALEACSCGSKNILIDESLECIADRKCNDCGLVETDIMRPSAIKKGFIAPPGYKIVNADYASLEPRAFAAMSNEDSIMKVYRDGLDLYSQVYCDMFDKEGKYSAHPDAPNFLKKKNKKARDFIKPLVLGIPYGSGDAQVANMVGYSKKYVDKKGIEQTRPDIEKGKEIRDQYLNTYPRLREYMATQEYMAMQYGYVDALNGRRRHFQWAKVVGDFFDQLGGDTFERVTKVNAFTGMFGSQLESPNVSVKDKDTGIVVLKLTESNLRALCKLMKINYETTPGRKDKIGVKDKGNWSYIRSMVKNELNNAKNHPIQGLAGAIANAAMLKVTRLFKEHNLDARIFIQVHDEISCYAREDQAEAAAKLLQEGMENNIQTSPLKAKVDMLAVPVICNTLKDAK
jgi:DNA polymerase I-like protein with 3'-5' exonuclease and polymerase domains